jgi:hypothetical protein
MCAPSFSACCVVWRPLLRMMLCVEDSLEGSAAGAASSSSVLVDEQRCVFVPGSATPLGSVRLIWALSVVAAR